MAQLQHFFRMDGGFQSTSALSSAHIIFILIFIAGLIWFVYFAKRWRGGWERRLSHPLGVLLLFSLAVELIWRIFSGCWSGAHFFSPFRLAQLIVLFDFFSSVGTLRKVATINLFYGAIIAMPAALNVSFNWPHITLLTHFLTVLAAGWLAIYQILAERQPWQRWELFVAEMMIVSYGIWLMIWNVWRHTNDGFLLQPPQSLARILQPVMPIYPALALFTYAALTYLTWFFARQLQCRLQEKEDKSLQSSNSR